MVSLQMLLSTLTFGFVATTVVGPISKDFKTWLNSYGYQDYNFDRSDIGASGSYGGRQTANEAISHRPIIFIHGNSDTAVASNSNFTGWSASISYFLQNGYTPAELYATTWGDNVLNHFALRTHDCETVQRLRKFFEAVLKYTNADVVDVISHSMGVTLARKVIKGGNLQGTDKNCSIGANLSNKVNVFIGIAGANYGLCLCNDIAAAMPEYLTCNTVNGFWSGRGNGNCTGFSPENIGQKIKYSEYLMDLNANPNLEGQKVYSMWSKADDLITNGCDVWGRSTALIPTSNDFVVFSNLTHMESKDSTVRTQFEFISKKSS
uniref:Lipase n=1 Tax=Panagrellus redivivus TaxID=6233 RepID=A0A7E4V436_PANRE